MSLVVHPVTPDRWDDLVALFGPSGAYSNCWCTWWILSGKEFGSLTAADRRAVLEGLVLAGQEPGLLAYEGSTPVGWCAVGPRARYARMMSSRSIVFRPLDAPAGGWVVNCFFVARTARRHGVAGSLLEAAVGFAFRNGATAVDAYPQADTTHGAASLFVGTVSMFTDAGFAVVAEVRGRPVMRRLTGRPPEAGLQ